MIIKFIEYIKEFNYIDSDVYNGPAITPVGDPSIGYRGGTNGGAIGGADASGDMYRNGDVTAKGDKKTFKYNVKSIKSKESAERKKAIKKLKELEDELYDKQDITNEIENENYVQTDTNKLNNIKPFRKSPEEELVLDIVYDIRSALSNYYTENKDRNENWYKFYDYFYDEFKDTLYKYSEGKYNIINKNTEEIKEETEALIKSIKFEDIKQNIQKIKELSELIQKIIL